MAPVPTLSTVETTSVVPPVLNAAIGADPAAYYYREDEDPVVAEAAAYIADADVPPASRFAVGFTRAVQMFHAGMSHFTEPAAPRARKAGVASKRQSRVKLPKSLGGRPLVINVHTPAPAAAKKSAKKPKAAARPRAPRPSAAGLLAGAQARAGRLAERGPGFTAAAPQPLGPALAAAEGRMMADARAVVAARYLPFEEPPARYPTASTMPTALSQSYQQFTVSTTSCTVGAATEHRAALVFTPSSAAAYQVAVFTPATGAIASWTTVAGNANAFLLSNAALWRPAGMGAKLQNLTQFINAGGYVAFSRVPYGAVGTGAIFGTFTGYPMTKIFAGANLEALDDHVSNWLASSSTLLENWSVPGATFNNTVIYVEIACPAAAQFEATQVLNVEYAPLATSANSVAVDSAVGSGAEVAQLLEVVSDEVGNPNTADFADRAQDVVRTLVSGAQKVAKAANTARRVWGVAKSAWSLAKGFLGAEVHDAWLRAGCPHPIPPDLVLPEHHLEYVAAYSRDCDGTFTAQKWYAMQHPVLEAHVFSARAAAARARSDEGDSDDDALLSAGDYTVDAYTAHLAAGPASAAPAPGGAGVGTSFVPHAVPRGVHRRL